jgi:CRP-like cAMP-binding protein
VVPVRNEMLSSLPASEREALGVHLTRTLLPRDSVLHETGATVKKVYFPESGAISLVVDLTTGEVIESALVGSDGAVGGFAALNGWPALNKAVVQIESSALVVSAEQLRRLCTPKSSLARLLGLHNQFLHAQAQQSAACHASHHLEARLSRWLLRASDLCGRSFALTQEALAAFLGVRRTSVSLTAQSLQDAGTIRYRRGVIEILDLDRLRKSSCECEAALRAQRDRLRRADALQPDLSGRAS